MAEQDRTTLDGFFNAGDIPTEGQFQDLIDSYVNSREDGRSGETVDSMVGLLTVNTSSLKDGATVIVQNFYSDTQGGGDPFYYDSDGDKADHNGITVIDPTHSTTPGNAGWWTSENTGTTGVFVRRKKNIYTLLDAGVQSGSSNNNKNAIDAVIAAVSDGDNIVGPSFDIYSSSFDINKSINFICPNSIIKHADLTNGNFVTVSADEAYIEISKIDFDEQETAGWTGGGHGLKISGNNIDCRNTTVSNTPLTGNPFDITGSDCVFRNCTAENAGDTGFRANGIATLVNGEPIGNITLIDCNAPNYRKKGFGVDGHAGTVLLDNFDGSFNTSFGEAASGLMQCDAGSGNKSKYFIMKNLNVNDDPLSNLIKFVNVRYTIIRDSTLTCNSTETIRGQNQYTGTSSYEEQEFICENVEFISDQNTPINMDGISGDESGINTTFINCKFERTAATIQPYMEVTGERNRFENCEISLFAADEFFVEPNGDGKPSDIHCAIINCENISGHAIYAYGFGDGVPDAGTMKLVGSIGDTINKNNGGTGSFIVQTNMSTPRKFTADSADSFVWTGWIEGDQIWHTDQASGSPMGRIVTVGGDASGSATVANMPNLS